MEAKIEKRLSFFGGPVVSFLPFIIFLILIVTFTFGMGSISDGALWLPAFLGMLITFFLAKDKKQYGETIIAGMAKKDSIVPVVCWIYAGVFSRILRESGLADGIAGVCTRLGISATPFIVVTFIATAVFATASGTGFGTIAAGMGVLYPAGVALGGHPALIAGAVISGAALGDNLAPVSDTTIVSATTQGVDVPGVVRSRVKYVIPAAIISIIAFLILGMSLNSGASAAVEAEYDSKTLLMLIPVVLTILIAIKTGDIIVATSYGILFGAAVGMMIGVFDFIHIDPSGSETGIPLIRIAGEGLDRTVDGVFLSGLSSMLQVIMLALLLFGSIEIMVAGGGTELLLDKLNVMVKGPVSAEMVISMMVMILAGLMGLNAPAILAVGPSFGKPLADKYGISRYRMANIMDAQSNVLAYTLPWTPAIIYTVGFATDGAAPLATTEIWPFVIYGWALLVVMMFSIFTGWGRHESGESTFEKKPATK